MQKIIILTFVFLLLAGTAMAFIHMDVLAGRVEDCEETIAMLRQELDKEKSSLAIMKRFVVVNHERLNRLQVKRMVTVTAYSPRPEETDDTPFITATNNKVRPGIIAVSRDLFENGWVFGKKVYIAGLGIFTIDDLMASHKKQQIDIFMPDTDDALTFGKKELEAYLIDA